MSEMCGQVPSSPKHPMGICHSSMNWHCHERGAITCHGRKESQSPCAGQTVQRKVMPERMDGICEKKEKQEHTGKDGIYLPIAHGTA